MAVSANRRSDWPHSLPDVSHYRNPLLPDRQRPWPVTAFVRKSFDSSIEKVSKLKPAQVSRTYNSDEGTMSGLELLMAMLDHTTHHRASAEMYLRARGITPVEYQF